MKGERVLCYEPDPKKAKVLYDSKIINVYETKDKDGLKSVFYKIHFQGWRSSWDRKVSADFILKDSEENRQLQQQLNQIEKTKMERKNRNKKRSISRSDSISKSRSERPSEFCISDTKLSDCSLPDNGTISITAPPPYTRMDSICKTTRSMYAPVMCTKMYAINTGHKDVPYPLRYPLEDVYSDSDCSTTESEKELEMEMPYMDRRIMLRVSERLRNFLEYDYDMIIKYGKQHALPARVTVVSILENFVKQNAIKLAFSTQTTDIFRRRCTQQSDKKEKEFTNLVKTVGLLKEVADGLRIYFDFTVTDYLLYKVERDYALSYLSEEFLQTYHYGCMEADSLSEDNDDDECVGEERRLRRKQHLSRIADDCSDITFENISCWTTSSPEASTPASWTIASSNSEYLKSLPLAYCVTTQTKDFLQELLAWKLLPGDAPAAPSMIFGATHLARLIVKLPEFLTSTPIADDKLKTLVMQLESFTNFLESHKDWFNEDNYAEVPVCGIYESYESCHRSCGMYCSHFGGPGDFLMNPFGDPTTMSMEMNMELERMSLNVRSTITLTDPSSRATPPPAPKQTITT